MTTAGPGCGRRDRLQPPGGPDIPPAGRLLRALIRRTARASADRHDMRPDARAALERTAEVDLATLVIWPGAEHTVHLDHELLAVCRDVLRRAAEPWIAVVHTVCNAWRLGVARSVRLSRCRGT